MTDIPLKAFVLLNKEHQDELENALKAGKRVQWHNGHCWIDLPKAAGVGAAFTHRIVPEQPRQHQVNWSHCGPDVMSFATDSDRGRAWGFSDIPNANHGFWLTKGASIYPAELFASFVPGNMPWQDSLIVRPSHTALQAENGS